MSALRPASHTLAQRLARQSARVAAFAGLAALATLGLTACTDDPGPVVVTETAAPTTDATASATETAAPTTASAAPTTPAVEPAGTDDDPADASAPFVADTLPDTETASTGAFLSPVNMRFGAHDGYDRIVIDLEGTGTPGWRAEYVDSPTGGASGEPVVLDGDAFLRIVVTGVVYETEPGASPYVGSVDFSPASGGVVEQVKYGSVFEGSVEVFVGLSSEEPFRVYYLDSPKRVVIDVQTP